MKQETYLKRLLENLTKEIPLELLKPAWKLARAYGHEWGAMDEPTKDMSIKEIEDNVFDHNKQYLGHPIFGPSLEYGTGTLVHTTSTGRLSWRIFPELGTAALVRFFIDRPIDKGVIQGYITVPNDENFVPYYEITYVNKNKTEKRHVWAVQDLLQVFGFDLTENLDYEELFPMMKEQVEA